MKYTCELCGLVYDEETGYPTRKIAPGTCFADLAEDFSCPSCGSEKEAFSPMVPKAAASARKEFEFRQYTKYSDVPTESQR